VILRVGNYTHPDSECTVARFITRTLNAAQQALTVKKRWDVRGTLHGDTPVLVIAAEVALKAALADPYPNLVLTLSDGTVVDSLLNAGASGGVQITEGPSFPVGTGAEGTTYSTFQYTAEATYEFAATNGTLLENWQEQVTIVGGGTRIAVVDTVDGDPVRQILNLRTKTRATQSGSATGRYDYPSAPPPLWPFDENQAERSVTYSAPRRDGLLLTGFGVSWNYVYESPAPLAGLPNPWPLS
jgi:hypothetical protein